MKGFLCRLTISYLRENDFFSNMVRKGWKFIRPKNLKILIFFFTGIFCNMDSSFIFGVLFKNLKVIIMELVRVSLRLF